MRTSRLLLPKTILALFVLILIAGIGSVIQFLPGDWSLTTVSKERVRPLEQNRPEQGALTNIDRSGWRLAAQDDPVDAIGVHAESQSAQQAKILFEHALVLQQQGRPSQAVSALEMVITLKPQMPEAYVNLGFSLYDLGEFDAARGAFGRAIELNPAQGNAYYGLAIVFEALQEFELALGAMRSFLHIADSPERYKVQARAAIWEWESMLGRGVGSEAELTAKGASALGAAK